MWGTQRYGIQPDLITFAKGVTSGYMPLGGVLVGERVRAPFWDEPVAGRGVPPRLHVLAATPARLRRRMANLDIIEREGLVARVAAAGAGARRGGPAAGGAPLVGEIRTVGLTAAVAIKPELLAADPRTARQGRRRGAPPRGRHARPARRTRSTSPRRS